MASAIPKARADRRRSIERHLVLASTLGTAAAGAGLATVAWQADSILLGLCGAALMLMSPALSVVATPMSCAPAVAVDDILLPDTMDRLQQADRLLHAVRGSRAVALMALSYAVVLWICLISGLIGARPFVTYYSLLTVAVAAIYFPWLSRRERAALAVRAELRQRLGEFRSGRNWNAG